jgi:hypothetical protein
MAFSPRNTLDVLLPLTSLSGVVDFESLDWGPKKTITFGLLPRSNMYKGKSEKINKEKPAETVRVEIHRLAY